MEIRWETLLYSPFTNLWLGLPLQENLFGRIDMELKLVAGDSAGTVTAYYVLLQWATKGGLMKTNWSEASFTTYYKNFNADACVWSSGLSSRDSKTNGNIWQPQGIDANGRRKLRWVQKYYMINDYCLDLNRFPKGRSRECCRGSRFL
ncbi:hypothetical protein Ddye_024427 [Dipteronia dyeriana]|uniref:Xyloglucan endo-transglycosylase C-terminal domain-containing protein n=1 Tax=Dipteronia dyeriana TaxID=168575 RepID=A0AAD9TVR9_9ROSI|nr:hypothetical protein Ddye_024427 [Dipteronia dyeriana]